MGGGGGGVEAHPSAKGAKTPLCESWKMVRQEHKTALNSGASGFSESDLRTEAGLHLLKDYGCSNLASVMEREKIISVKLGAYLFLIYTNYPQYLLLDTIQ